MSNQLSISNSENVLFLDIHQQSPTQDCNVNTGENETPQRSNTYSDIASSCPTDQITAFMQNAVTENVIANTRLNKRPSKLDQMQEDWRRMGSDALTTVMSALYGKVMVVMGIAFPMSEVISTRIPNSYYEVYYLYLYFGSIMFLGYMYLMLCNVRRKEKKQIKQQTLETVSVLGLSKESVCDEKLNNVEMTLKEVKKPDKKSKKRVNQPTQHFGSFYLRMGAVAFGIGSMIYSGLEVGQYFELEQNTKCHNVLVAVTPGTRMAFIFTQMYFIFLNEDEQMIVTSHTILSRFGLMHMIATNLSVWLNVLIQETKHEILTFYNPENNTIGFNKQTVNFVHPGSISTMATLKPDIMNQTMDAIAKLATNTTNRKTRSLKGPHYIYECRRTNIIGSLVQNASPFLFPCTIEYSLICAAILYVMWKNITNAYEINSLTEVNAKTQTRHPYKKAPHHYSVDCAQAHKGLFLGILFLVLTIISLILFFVLVSKSEFMWFAVMEVNMCELALYALSTMASVVGMIRVRQLKFNGTQHLELDNILLVGAQSGILIYSMFSIIGGHFTKEENTIVVLLTASASLIQTMCQSVFILDASRRSCVTQEQVRKKPGREIITFLLVSNLAMWAISTLEKSRADSHPIQLHFYGLWAWTIITHVSMPLAIFYRFHSTVCLCEIWKRAYKIKNT